MDHRSQDQVEAWLRAACADADHRALGALKPMLEALARSTSALREADRAAREAADAGGRGPADASPAGLETTE